MLFSTLNWLYNINNKEIFRWKTGKFEWICQRSVVWIISEGEWLRVIFTNKCTRNEKLKKRVESSQFSEEQWRVGMDGGAPDKGHWNWFNDVQIRPHSYKLSPIYSCQWSLAAELSSLASPIWTVKQAVLLLVSVPGVCSFGLSYIITLQSDISSVVLSIVGPIRCCFRASTYSPPLSRIQLQSWKALY